MIEPKITKTLDVQNGERDERDEMGEMGEIHEILHIMHKIHEIHTLNRLVFSMASLHSTIAIRVSIRRILCICV